MKRLPEQARRWVLRELDRQFQQRGPSSGKFHTTTGEAQRVSIVRTASNPHLCGDQDAAET